LSPDAAGALLNYAVAVLEQTIFQALLAQLQASARGHEVNWREVAYNVVGTVLLAVGLEAWADLLLGDDRGTGGSLVVEAVETFLTFAYYTTNPEYRAQRSAGCT
jgi:hypothetical protein